MASRGIPWHPVASRGAPASSLVAALRRPRLARRNAHDLLAHTLVFGRSGRRKETPRCGRFAVLSQMVVADFGKKAR